jgi:hypothetical protein
MTSAAQALHDVLAETVAWIDSYPGPKPTRCERCPANAAWRIKAGSRPLEATLDEHLCVGCAQQILDNRRRPGFVSAAPCSIEALTPAARLNWRQL